MSPLQQHMDSEPPPRSESFGSKSDPTADGGEDEPYSPGSFVHAASPVLGVALGLVTLVVPLAVVIGDRTGIPTAEPVLTNQATAHGLAQPAGITSPRTGQLDGGDSSRQP